MRYVDAGYIAALGTLFVYAVTLVLRRRGHGSGRLRRAAVTDTIDGSPPPPSIPADSRGGPALPPPRRRRSRRLWIVFALLAAAFAFLLVEGLGSSLNYFDTVNQAFAHRGTLGTTTFRLEGDVVPGSIRPTALGTDFAICQGAHTVAVQNTGSPPQLFQINIPVVVVGHFTSATSSDFVSNQILVKHTATYTAKYPGRVKANTGTAC
jgi:cytochrome c-type biogenesis protein CcmE